MANTSVTSYDGVERPSLEWFRSLLVGAELVDETSLLSVVDDALLQDDLQFDSLAFLELHALLAEHFDGWSLPRQLDPSVMRVRDVLHYCRLAAEHLRS